MAGKFQEWCQDNHITIQYIQPGKPMQKGYIERLNRTYREDVLDANLFESLEQVWILSDEWVEQYNRFHPHQSLGGLAPVTYAKQVKSTEL
ncbi:transposase [Larkinella bovis]|uniref:Transposase n=1 Tax=Larkinella bovis TaxID=683041 RepID=A0ABW0I6S5_9BACT